MPSNIAMNIVAVINIKLKSNKNYWLIKQIHAFVKTPRMQLILFKWGLESWDTENEIVK